jgi:predicted metal-dependent hydrolase
VEVDVVRKSVKNLNLLVYPPDGQVRVAVPLSVSDEAVRRWVAGKLGWIRRHQARFEARQSERAIASGETYYFRGRRYRLRVTERSGPSMVSVNVDGSIDLQVQPDANAFQRERVLQCWYREQLRALIPPLLSKWETAIGVQVSEWGVKRMKTRWGSCNPRARRIWLNLELVKRPIHSLEYVVVHELTHLIERRHGERFKALMDQHMPQWRSHRAELNSEPVAREG